MPVPVPVGVGEALAVGEVLAEALGDGLADALAEAEGLGEAVVGDAEGLEPAPAGPVSARLSA